MRTQRLRDIEWLLKVMQVRTENCPKLGLHGIPSQLPGIYLLLTWMERVWGILSPSSLGRVYRRDMAYGNH